MHPTELALLIHHLYEPVCLNKATWQERISFHYRQEQTAVTLYADIYVIPLLARERKVLLPKSKCVAAKVCHHTLGAALNGCINLSAQHVKVFLRINEQGICRCGPRRHSQQKESKRSEI